jgi:sulfatase modifying factor 1
VGTRLPGRDHHAVLFFGPTISASQANYNGNAIYGEGKKGKNRKEVTPVGSFPPNAWGLYDLHGNVWEMCADWCGDYQPGEQTDPKGPSRGQTRVMRGGARGHHPNYLRSAARGGTGPDYRESCIGFRVAVRAS